MSAFCDIYNSETISMVCKFKSMTDCVFSRLAGVDKSLCVNGAKYLYLSREAGGSGWNLALPKTKREDPWVSKARRQTLEPSVNFVNLINFVNLTKLKNRKNTYEIRNLVNFTNLVNAF